MEGMSPNMHISSNYFVLQNKKKLKIVQASDGILN